MTYGSQQKYKTVEPFILQNLLFAIFDLSAVVTSEVSPKRHIYSVQDFTYCSGVPSNAKPPSDGKIFQQMGKT